MVRTSKFYKRKKHFRLADLITERILKNYKNNILAVGIFGSVANDTHDIYSDLDLIIITRKRVKNKFFILRERPIHTKHPIFGKDIKISIFFKTRREATRQALEISDIAWPTKAAMLLNVLPLYDPQNFFIHLHKRFDSLKDAAEYDWIFRNLSGKWLSIAYEFLGKICKSESDTEKILICAKEFLFCIANACKAANKEFFFDTYNFVKETEQLFLKPQNTVVLMREILNSCDTECVYCNAMKLWKNVNSFARKYQIRITIYSKHQLYRELRNL